MSTFRSCTFLDHKKTADLGGVHLSFVRHPRGYRTRNAFTINRLPLCPEKAQISALVRHPSCTRPPHPTTHTPPPNPRRIPPLHASFAPGPHAQHAYNKQLIPGDEKTQNSRPHASSSLIATAHHPPPTTYNEDKRNRSRKAPCINSR